MAKTFLLEIVTPERQFFTGQVESLILPASDGSYGVEPGHEPVVAAVEPGETRYKVDGQWQDIAVGRGFARAADNEVILIVDTAERPEDIDENRARAAAERARERLQVQQSRREYYSGQVAMTRAMTRLKVKERKYS